jgi:hypothetical protein
VVGLFIFMVPSVQCMRPNFTPLHSFGLHARWHNKHTQPDFYLEKCNRPFFLNGKSGGIANPIEEEFTSITNSPRVVGGV